MSKIKNGGLDQYGAEPFEQQQFGRAGTEGVNSHTWLYHEVSVVWTVFLDHWTTTVKPFNLAALKVGELACKIILAK